MPATTKKTLITVLAALAGLAAIALTPAAFAEVPPVQAADAQLAALETKAGPADRETRARTDADPARARVSEIRPVETHPFSGGRDADIRGFTAGTDAPRRRSRRRAQRRARRRY